jgi:hypothetical protein
MSEDGKAALLEHFDPEQVVELGAVPRAVDGGPLTMLLDLEESCPI